MKRLLLLNGLKRSGNHVFIEWVRANSNILFFNNAVWIERVLRGAPLPEPIRFDDWLDKQSPIPFLARVRAINKDVLVSFEDMEPEWRLFSAMPQRILSILIVRDPYNLFASRIRAAKLNLLAFSIPPSPVFNRMIDLWKAYARQFLAQTDDGPDVPVYYNRLIASAAYRSKIADRLGIRNSDAGLDVVPDHAGGSSFDGVAFSARGRQMDVLNRVDWLTPEERGYLAIVERDDEVRALHARIEAATAD